MRIFLTGATGVIGRRVVPDMIAAGHDVTAQARSDGKAELLRAMGARTARLDLLDAPAVRKAVRGHDAVVNLATHIPSTSVAMVLPWAWRENDRLRRDASAILAEAAAAAGAARFVQESFAPTYPDSGDRWIDEDVPIRPSRTTSPSGAATGSPLSPQPSMSPLRDRYRER